MIDMENKYNIDPKEYGFNTIGDMCKAHGIEKSTFYNRIKRGKSIEEALENNKNKISKTGVDPAKYGYKSISAMCKANNISLGTFWCRVSRGMSVEEAIKPPESKDINIKEKCKELGIDVSTYYKRLKRGVKENDAMKPTNKSEVDRVKAMCKEAGISVDTYRDRIRRGLSEEEALKTIEGKLNRTTGNREDIIYRKYCYSSIKEMWDALGRVSFSNTMHRIRNYWDLIPALISPAYEVNLWFVRLDGKTAYKVTWSENPVTTIELILHYNKELLGLYRKGNPEDKWQPLV